VIEALVIVYQAGNVTSLVRSSTRSPSAFGGPGRYDVAGDRLAKPVHHIATINARHLAVTDSRRHFFELPLMYGLFYDGCSLRYEFGRGSIIVRARDLGSPTEDWPYPHYPSLLPYIPLAVGGVERKSWDEFSRLTSNLPTKQPSEVVVLVPPPATIGFSVWGPEGDAEGVTMVFECDLESRHVVAYNVCS
jgi:hypothetical protein